MNSLKLLRFVPVLLLVLSFQAHSTVLKIATVSPDGTSWMQTLREGAQQVKKQTNGRVTFKFYPGGVMGNDANVLRKIRIGQLQGGAVTTGNISSIAHDVDIYGLPYLFGSLQDVDRVRAGMDQYLMDRLEDKGFVSFGFAEGGFSYLMSDSPLKTVDDVRDKKVWIPSGNKIGEAVFSSVGISPVPLPISDVLTGLQTGLIDTVIASPIGAIALQWHTRVNYLIDVPLTYFSALLVIDKKTFDKLKKEDQETVRAVMKKTFEEIDARNRKDNKAAREALKNHGIEFVTVPQSTLKEWQELGKQAVKKLEQENEYSKETFDLLMKYVNEAKASKL